MKGDCTPVQSVQFRMQRERLPVTSSNEPSWAPEEREFYREILKILQAADVSFAVGGAFAVQRQTGVWRETKDLDLLLTPHELSSALSRLRETGFETWIEDPIWLAKVQRDAYFVDLITGMGNAGLFIEQSWIDRAMPDCIFGVECRVLCSEELIVSKLFVTRRERFDGADIVHIIRRCATELDWDRLLNMVDPHWELLLWTLVLFAYVYPTQIKLVPQHVWDLLTRRFAQHVSSPSSTEPFRGTLIDPCMFAIDVNEWGERDLYREYAERHLRSLNLLELPTENKE